MRRGAVTALGALMLTGAAPGQVPLSFTAVPLAPPLDGLVFLVGEWRSGQGTVADTGGSATGRSTFSIEAGGHALLRRDHSDVADAHGTPTGGFDQIMLVYPEGRDIHADYSNGQHVIHYGSAAITPGRAVTFLTAPRPGEPAFRLTYTLAAPTTLDVAFAMSPPGSSAFRPIATGTLRRPTKR